MVSAVESDVTTCGGGKDTGGVSARRDGMGLQTDPRGCVRQRQTARTDTADGDCHQHWSA